MRRLGTLFLTLVLLLPTTSSAQVLNAGFIQGLWYSNPTPFADKPVRIYVALRNNSKQDLSGLVIFTDNDSPVGTTTIKALPGRLVEAWIDWTPVYGEHTITATLSEIKINAIRSNPEEVEVISTLAKNTISVDYDTDDDGIGNKNDDDDDGDGIFDVDEIIAGTDPLVFNEPPVITPEQASSTTATEDSQTNAEITAEIKSLNGLEQYVGDGAIKEVLTTLTSAVNTTKETLDAYREERIARINTDPDQTSTKPKTEGITQTSSSSDSITDSSSNVDNATITRSYIGTKGNSFLSSIGSLFKAFTAKSYSLVLWLTSELLGHTIIVQLLLLLGLLFSTYKLAKKIGSRPKH